MAITTLLQAQDVKSPHHTGLSLAPAVTVLHMSMELHMQRMCREPAQ